MAVVAGTLVRKEMAGSAGEAIEGLETKGINPTEVLKKFNKSFPKPQPEGKSKKDDTPQPELTPSPSPEQDQELSGIFNKLFRLTSGLSEQEVAPELKQQTLGLVNDACSQLGLPKPQETLQAVQQAFSPHVSATNAPTPTLTPATNLQHNLAQVAANNQLTPSQTTSVLQGISKGAPGYLAHLHPDKLTAKFTQGAQDLHTNAAALQSHGLSHELVEPGLNFMHHHEKTKGTKANPADVVQTLTNMPRELAHDPAQVGNEFSKHLDNKSKLGEELQNHLMRHELEQVPGLRGTQLNQAKDIGRKFLMSPEGKGFQTEKGIRNVAQALQQAVHDDPTVLGRLKQGAEQVGNLIKALDRRQNGTSQSLSEKPTPPKKLPAAFSTDVPGKPNPLAKQ